jgi:hypothetical protein
VVKFKKNLKNELEKNMREWFNNQNKEDLSLCNSDFWDYISIIEKPLVIKK